MNASALGRSAIVAVQIVCSPIRADIADGPIKARSDSSQTQPILEEVVITAERREERLQDVPISASVLSSVDIDRRQLDQVSTLQYAAPNLTITPYPGSQTRVTIAMRGQLEPELFPTLDPAVGVYLDGVYIARMSGANLDLIDMDRVEVLRGPQGTLFGRNTIGGAIDLIPHRPTSEFSGAVAVDAGNYDQRDLVAIVNVPLSNDSALRFAVSHREHDGYGRNVRLDRDLDADDTDFARVQLRLTPADRWDLNLSFDFTRVDTPLDLLTLLAASPPNTLVPAARGNPTDSLTHYENPLAHSIDANRAGTADADVGGTSGTLTIDLGPFTVKSIAAYRWLQSNDNDLDLDGTPYDLFTILARDEREHQFSEELQAYGDALEDRLTWIGGLHYFDEHGTFSQSIEAIAPITLSEAINLPRGTVDNDSIAAYAQLTYAITPTFRATLGARYNRDRRQLTSRNARILSGSEVCTLAPNVLDEPGVCRASLPYRTFSYVPFTFGVEFEPINTALLYAKVSRGYRAGGYNLRGTSEVDLDTFEPEQVTAYEVGAHAELLDQHLRLNLAVYRSMFDDIQLLERVPAPGGALPLPLTQNGGRAHIDGGELEISALLSDLRLAGTLGITDAKYTHIDPRVVDVTVDSKFLQTPDATASVAADLPIVVGSREINLHADYSWRDDVAFQYDPRSLAHQDAYGLLNAMISVQFDPSNIELRLWGRNLTDRHYLVRATDSVSLVTAMPGDPRTYGVSLMYRFGSGSSGASSHH